MQKFSITICIDWGMTTVICLSIGVFSSFFIIGHIMSFTNYLVSVTIFIYWGMNTFFCMSIGVIFSPSCVYQNLDTDTSWRSCPTTGALATGSSCICGCFSNLVRWNSLLISTSSITMMMSVAGMGNFPGGSTKILLGHEQGKSLSWSHSPFGWLTGGSPDPTPSMGTDR